MSKSIKIYSCIWA